MVTTMNKPRVTRAEDVLIADTATLHDEFITNISSFCKSKILVKLIPSSTNPTIVIKSPTAAKNPWILIYEMIRIVNETSVRCKRNYIPHCTLLASTVF